jgi:hypothetical protein
MATQTFKPNTCDWRKTWEITGNVPLKSTGLNTLHIFRRNKLPEKNYERLEGATDLSRGLPD